MNWEGWQDFLSMGGYGLYVWGAYVVTLALLVTEVMMLGSRKRAILGQIGRRAEAAASR